MVFSPTPGLSPSLVDLPGWGNVFRSCVVSRFHERFYGSIEIHARVLKHRLDKEAPTYARQRALAFQNVGDSQGYTVWLLVAATAERLLEDRPPNASQPSQRLANLTKIKR